MLFNLISVFGRLVGLELKPVEDVHSKEVIQG